MIGAQARRGLVVGGVTIAAAITFAARPARPDCSNGASEGWDPCAANPGCCSYEIVTCPNGGWYTRYFVKPPCQQPGSGGDAGTGAAIPNPRDASSPGSPREAGSGSGGSPPSGDGGLGGLTPGPSLDCLLMKSWTDRYVNILNAFRDPNLAYMGQHRDWDLNEYERNVWRQVFQKEPPQRSDPWLMATDWTKCQVVNGPQGCTRIQQMGLPSAACTASLDHEAVHVAQCQAAKRPGTPLDPYDLPTWEQREIDAYQKEVDELRQWLQDHHCSE